MKGGGGGGGILAFGGMLRMSRQMRPPLSMLGWYTGVTKRTLGGSKGYLYGMQQRPDTQRGTSSAEAAPYIAYATSHDVQPWGPGHGKHGCLALLPRWFLVVIPVGKHNGELEDSSLVDGVCRSTHLRNIVRGRIRQHRERQGIPATLMQPPYKHSVYIAGAVCSAARRRGM